MIPRNVRILLVEDDDIDAEAVVRGFSKAGIECPVFRAANGIQALSMLREEDGHFQDVPYIILLDLKMPQMNGLEFLEAVRNDDSLRKSVIFVLTTSNDSTDKLKAYTHCVAGYVTKSKAGIEFRDLIRMLDDYSKIVELPICG